MTIKRINEFPEGSGSLTSDDIFLFMDDPSSGGVTKKISLSQITVAISGNLGSGGGLTTEEVDDRVSNLLVGGSGIILNYNDSANVLTISTSGLQPSGNYSVVGHSHSSSDITNFNSSVSGLLPVKNIVAGSNISVSSVSGTYTIASTGGSSITVANSGDNRILTSTGSSTGINAESNLTFDGSGLSVNGTAQFNQVFPTVSNVGSVNGTINTNVSLAQIFDITLTGNATLANPTNPVNGVTIRWRIRQDNSGNRSVTLGNKFVIPSTATNPLPFSTGSGVMDILAATYHAGRDKWDVIAFVPGY